MFQNVMQFFCFAFQHVFIISRLILGNMGVKCEAVSSSHALSLVRLCISYCALCSIVIKNTRHIYTMTHTDTNPHIHSKPSFTVLFESHYMQATHKKVLNSRSCLIKFEIIMLCFILKWTNFISYFGNTIIQGYFIFQLVATLLIGNSSW